jgi:hypothetical protein
VRNRKCFHGLKGITWMRRSAMPPESGWISYGSGENEHLSPEGRSRERALRERHRVERGALLAVVSVDVYEHSAEAGVGFPDGSLLQVESPSAEIAAVVLRAGAALNDWR